MNDLTISSGSIWISAAALLIGIYGALRERRKQTQEEKDLLLKPVWERLVAAEGEHRTFKEGVEDVFRNQVVYRRDYTEYKEGQDNTNRRIEDKLDRIIEMLIKRASK